MTEDDPYVLTARAVQNPPATLWRALRQTGPGLILAASIVGTGELIATTHLGARTGFALLWLVIVSCFIKVFVQAELGRYAISSGQTSLAALRTLPGLARHAGWWWLIMMLCTQAQLAAVVGGTAQALYMAFGDVFASVMPAVARLFPAAEGRPELPFAVFVAAATSALLAAGSYSLVEKGSTLLVAAFTCMTVACVALLPGAGCPLPPARVLSGLCPGIPDVDGAALAALAMFGITGVGAAELIAYPYWCIEKGYARRTGPRDSSSAWHARARGWLAVMKLDVFVSMVVYTVATVAFYMLGAATLHAGAGGLPRTVDGMLKALARMYEPVLGQRGATVLVIAGVFAVLYSTLYSATAANSRALADFLTTNCAARFGHPTDRRRWVRIFCVAFPLLDLLLFTLVKDPVGMVLFGGFAQAITLPMIGGAALYLRYRRTDERLRPGVLWDVLLWLSLAGVCIAAAWGLYDVAVRLLRT